MEESLEEIDELKNTLRKLREEKEDCAKKGHPHALSYGIFQRHEREAPKRRIYCFDCRRFYDRELSEEEKRRWNEDMEKKVLYI